MPKERDRLRKELKDLKLSLQADYQQKTHYNNETKQQLSPCERGIIWFSYYHIKYDSNVNFQQKNHRIYQETEKYGLFKGTKKVDRQHTLGSPTSDFMDKDLKTTVLKILK